MRPQNEYISNVGLFQNGWMRPQNEYFSYAVSAYYVLKLDTLNILKLQEIPSWVSFKMAAWAWGKKNSFLMKFQARPVLEFHR